MSVDGVHCRINEPKDPERCQNPKYYSHKFKQAGLTYELALSVYEDKLLWMNGSFPAGTNDITVFRKGLKAMIPPGKRVIADGGYAGEPEIISTPNSYDSKDLAKFKSRVRLRQETFNKRIKIFKCLDERFRHGIAKHESCFEAICVVVQYQIENGSPLYDV